MQNRQTMSKISDHLVTNLKALLPSLFTHERPERARISNTAYMSGIRGIACVMVYIQHWVLLRYPWLISGYGSTPDNMRIMQLPFFRLPVGGKAFVSSFYIISGFALSYTPLRMVREGKQDKLLANLASSTFRRVLRLYLPCLPMTLFTAIWFAAGSSYPPFPDSLRQASLCKQIQVWWSAMMVTIDPFAPLDIRFPKGPPYASQLWTLPYEARGSFTVFGLIIGLSRTKELWRLIILFGLAMYTLLTYRWDLFLFLAGMIIAEIQLKQNSRKGHSSAHTRCEELPTLSATSLKPCCVAGGCDHFFNAPQIRKSVQRAAAIFAFFLCIHVFCFPIKGASTSFGYKTLVLLTPKLYASQDDLGFRGGSEAFWLAIVPPLWIFLIAQSPTLQHPFKSKFMQWLSDISFSLYIIHPWLNHTLGEWLIRHLSRWESWGGELITFGLSTLIMVVVTFWLADIYWKVFDVNSVAITKWLDEKLQDKRED